MQHRRPTGIPARLTALRTALGALLACCALGATALAAAGGASTDPAAAVVQAARQHLGDPYVWGATGPTSWDCSGLTSRLWREVGGVKDIPRVASDQQAWAVPIPAAQLLVGDLVFFGNPVTHVGLYAGNGTMVDASSSQHGVVARKIWTGDVIRYGRVPRPGMPAVTPWTPPPLPAPTPSVTVSPAATATTGTTGPSPATARSPAPAGSPGGPTPARSPAATATPTPVRVASGSAPSAAAVTTPLLRGLPAPDLPAVTSIAAHAAGNAASVRGAQGWTDLRLVQVAWRHAGGGLLPDSRPALAAAGGPIPVGAARIGDLVVYGAPANHLGVYLGHGYLADVSPSHGTVVVRRVYSGNSVRFVRLDTY